MSGTNGPDYSVQNQPIRKRRGISVCPGVIMFRIFWYLFRILCLNYFISLKFLMNAMSATISSPPT